MAPPWLRPCWVAWKRVQHKTWCSVTWIAIPQSGHNVSWHRVRVLSYPIYVILKIYVLLHIILFVKNKIYQIGQSDSWQKPRSPQTGVVKTKWASLTRWLCSDLTSANPPCTRRMIHQTRVATICWRQQVGPCWGVGGSQDERTTKQVKQHHR